MTSLLTQTQLRFTLQT